MRCPLVIDTDGWGRNWQSVVNNGPTTLAQDPDRNLILFWHNWDPSHWNNATKAKIKGAVDQSIAKNISFIFGEFGPCEQCNNCAGTRIEWEYMIEYAHQNDIWRWDDCHGIVKMDKDTYGSWANFPWGEGVAVSTIQKTARKTPYFTSGTCTGVKAAIAADWTCGVVPLIVAFDGSGSANADANQRREV